MDGGDCNREIAIVKGRKWQRLTIVIAIRAGDVISSGLSDPSDRSMVKITAEVL